jgi:integrase
MSKVWYVGYRTGNGNYANRKIGAAAEFTVSQARDEAREFTALLKRGDIILKDRGKKRMGLGEFMDQLYAPWRMSNHKAAHLTLKMLRSQFGRQFYPLAIADLKVSEFYTWRKNRLEQGRKAATINKNIIALKAALNWGAKHGYIQSNPLRELELLKEYDSDTKVRYLSGDERDRLMAALDARETEIAGKAEAAGREREFADDIKPMVLLSLHTGMRQGNLFSLLWGDIDFKSNTVTLRAAVTKAGKTLRLPINSVALRLLTSWMAQSENTSPDAPVFPATEPGGPRKKIKKAWAWLLQQAEIENFRWHDMRHDFASQLVMKGVNMNTVRELLGHNKMEMTMRYAHLAPSVKNEAVELLAYMEGCE